VEKLCKRPGRLKSHDHILEQALTQLFIDNVDIAMNAGEAGSQLRALDKYFRVSGIAA